MSLVCRKRTYKLELKRRTQAKAQLTHHINSIKIYLCHTLFEEFRSKLGTLWFMLFTTTITEHTIERY